MVLNSCLELSESVLYSLLGSKQLTDGDRRDRGGAPEATQEAETPGAHGAGQRGRARPGGSRTSRCAVGSWPPPLTSTKQRGRKYLKAIRNSPPPPKFAS